MICQLCNKDFKHLGLHLKYKHKDITQKEYYDKFLKKEHEGFCFTCGKEMKFYDLSHGYQHYCNSKCELADMSIKEKAKQTYKEKTGYDHNMHNPESKNKVKNTNIEKYGGIGFASNILSKKSLDTFNKNNNTNIESPAMIVHSINSLEQQRIKTRLKNNNGNYLSELQLNNIKIANKDPERIKKIITSRFSNNNGRYFTENYYEILKQKPLLKTYSYANMIKFVPEQIGNCICHCNKCNNNYEINLKTLRTRTYNNQELCTICNPLSKQYSNGEKEVAEYIKTIYNDTIIENDRTILNGKEIDIYLPNKKIGFEFDGTYWHADPRFYEPDDIIDAKNLHAWEVWQKDNEKDLLAESIGIKILRIPEYDWEFNNEAVKNYIKENLR